MKKFIIFIVSIFSFYSCSIEEACKDCDQTPTIIQEIIYVTEVGEPGQDGADGISSTWIIEGNNCITPIQYVGDISNEVSRGETLCFEPTNGIDGINGQDGQNGVDGQDGLNGSDGEQGEAGEDGTNSRVELVQVEEGIIVNVYNNEVLTDSQLIPDGQNGLNGNDGQDGTPGQNGTDGSNGVDGQNGSNGYSTSVRFEESLNCENGGTTVVSFILETGEIISSTDICQVKCVVKDPCVELQMVDYLYDFEHYFSGDIVSTYDLVEFTAYRNTFQGNQFMIFDSHVETGEDDDLVVNSGNIGIISEDNDASDPDDNGQGGIMRMVFQDEVTFNSLDLVDFDSPKSVITFYDSNNNVIESVKLIKTGGHSIETQHFDVEKVKVAIITLMESGGIDNLNFSKEELIYTCN